MYNLLDLKELFAKHKMKVRGIIQIGASMGEDIENFRSAGVENVVYIDANPLSMPELRRRVGDRAYQALMWNKDDEVVQLHIMDFLACSTVRTEGLGKMTELRTSDFVGVTLRTFLARNNLNPDEFNMLFLDVEGAELEVLEGADLSKFDYIYTEFQTNLPNTPEALAAALSEFGEVERVTHAHTDPADGEWGDILFARNTKIGVDMAAGKDRSVEFELEVDTEVTPTDGGKPPKIKTKKAKK